MEINFGGQKLRAMDSAQPTAGLYNLQNEAVWRPADGEEKRLELVRSARDSGTLNQYYIPHIICTDNPVRNNDIVEMRGVITENYLKNPQIFYEHCPDYPVGNSRGLTIFEHSIVSNTWFHGLTDESKDVAVLSLSGVVPMVSIGFIPIESLEETIVQDGGAIVYPSWSNKRQRHKRWELFEYSVVSLPLDPSASELRKFNSLDDILRFSVSERLLPADSALTRAKLPVIINSPNNVRRAMDGTTSATEALQSAGAAAVASLVSAPDYDAALLETLKVLANVGIQLAAAGAASAKEPAVQDLAASATEAMKAIRDAAESLMTPAPAADVAADPNAPPTDPNAPQPAATQGYKVRAGAVLSGANKQRLQAAVENIQGVLQSSEPEKQSLDATEVQHLRRTVNELTKTITRQQADIDALKNNKPAEPEKKRGFSDITIN